MENNKELTVEEQRELMKECLEKAINGQVGVFLAETVFNSAGELVNTRECDSRITDKCHPVIRFTREYVFCDLEFTGGEADRKSIAYLFNKYLDKNTDAILSNSPGEFFFNLNIVGAEDAETYVIDMLNPCFMSVENDIMHFSFPMDNVAFNKMTANIKSIDEMIAYEERMELDEWKDIEPDKENMTFAEANEKKESAGTIDFSLTDYDR